MKNELSVKNVIVGQLIVSYDENKKPVPGEAVYRTECWTRYKMNKREILAEASSANFDPSTIRFWSEKN